MPLWPIHGAESSTRIEELIRGISEALDGINSDIDAKIKGILSRRFMIDDEKAAKISKLEIRRQKAIYKAKLLSRPVGEYLGRLSRAMERLLENRQPDLEGRAWEEASARSAFVETEVKDLIAEPGRIVDRYVQSEEEFDDVAAWLFQKHGLDQLSPGGANKVAFEDEETGVAKAWTDLNAAISDFHPADPESVRALQKARRSIVPLHDHVSAMMGKIDEQEIRGEFGIGTAGSDSAVAPT